MSSIFSSNSETNVSELLENIEEMLTQPHNSVENKKNNPIFKKRKRDILSHYRPVLYITTNSYFKRVIHFFERGIQGHPYTGSSLSKQTTH